MPALHIDFETRSTVDLRKTGAYVYAEHESTDLWCACYAFDDETVRTWRPGEDCPDDVRAHIEAGYPLYAHNASFERTIWRYILNPRYGWPEPTIEQWHCTAAMAAAMALPRSLEDAARALGLDVQKDKEGQGLMLRMARPRRVENDQPIWWDVPERVDRLIQYCIRDVETERALHEKVRPLSNTEQNLFWLDMKINERGLQADLELVGAARRLVNQVKKELDTDLALVTNGLVTNCDKVAKLTEWVKMQGVEVDSLDKESLKTIAASDAPEQVKKACALRQMAAKKSTAKLNAFNDRASQDGRIRGNLLYHGASTGRWAGAGIQCQNFPRPSKNTPVEAAIDDILAGTSASMLDVLYGPPMAVIADCLRGAITAAPGRDLIAADFNAIEARVLAWCAKQQDVVEAFASGACVYRQMASKIYGVPADTLAKDSLERFVGKTAVLGCGYGCGGPKFTMMCNGFGIDLDESEGTRIVEVYRTANRKIKQFWYATEEAAIAAVRNPGSVTTSGPVKFRTKGGFLWMVLPSGRPVCYPSPKILPRETPWGEMKDALTYLGVNAFTRKWTRENTYGGKLVENLVQAIARDLLAEAMLRIENAGYPIVATVHDEIMAEVPKGFGSLAEFEQLMAVVPHWAPGCPVAVEGWRASRFQK